MIESYLGRDRISLSPHREVITLTGALHLPAPAQGSILPERCDAVGGMMAFERLLRRSSSFGGGPGRLARHVGVSCQKTNVHIPICLKSNRGKSGYLGQKGNYSSREFHAS